MKIGFHDGKEEVLFLCLTDFSKASQSSHNLSLQTDQGGIIRNPQQKENVKETSQI